MVGGLLTAFAQTDMTSKLVNPSFENGFNGWMQTGMQTQDNTVFTLKDGNVYAEKWVARGSAVGDGSVTQVVKGLECGRYRLTAAAQNIQEDTPLAGGREPAHGSRRPCRVQCDVCRGHGRCHHRLHS